MHAIGKRSLLRASAALTAMGVLVCWSVGAETGGAEASSPRLSIIEPADRSVAEGELTAVSIKADDLGIDAIRIAVNGVAMSDIPLEKGRNYYCATGTLSFGPNEIQVSAVKGGKVVESGKVTVFFRSDLSRTYGVSPAGFQKRPFHRKDREAACAACHRMDVAAADIRPQRPEDSLCYQCHSKITAAYSNVHGPAARWDCLACHERQSAPAKYEARTPSRDLCFVCHEEKRGEWAPKKYVHGPTATGKCTICHSPHASNNLSWLKKPSWELCTTCHEDRASGAHVIVGFGSGSHPTRGKPDPTRYGKELSCASCHNPHASDSKSLFINDQQDPYSLCKLCHKV